MASWPGVKNTPPARACKTLIRGRCGFYTPNPLDAYNGIGDMASWPGVKNTPPARACKKEYGVVAKWQGKGLQNPDQGFKSPRRL
jgi:hypothetical protein